MPQPEPHLRRFSFGSDPEHVYVGVRSDGVEIMLSATQPSLELQYGTERPAGTFGRDGAGRPGEYSSNIKPTFAELCKDIRDAYRKEVRRVNHAQISQSYEKIKIAFGPMPHDESLGGHIHITTKDLDWYYTEQALLVLPFWISLPTWLYDRGHTRRARGSYGNHLNLHTSPGINAHRVSVTAPDGRRVKCWSGGWRGWEYRTPSMFFAPGRELIQHKYDVCITNVVMATDREAEKQLDFLTKVIEQLGGKIYREFGVNSLSALTTRRHNIRDDDDAVVNDHEEHTFLHEIFMANPSPHGTISHAPARKTFPALLQAMLDVRREVPIAGFDEIFTDIQNALPSGLAYDYNAVFSYYPGTVEIRYPALPAFPTVQDAKSAIDDAYLQFVASTTKDSWIGRGRALYPILPIKAKTREGATEFRDAYVKDIIDVALALAEYAVRVKLKCRFMPRRQVDACVYGGTEARFITPNMMALFPSEYAANAVVRDMFRAENYDIGTDPDPHMVGGVFLRMSFRESASPLKFKSLGLFALYHLGFIKTMAASSPSGHGISEGLNAGLGALFG